MSQELYYQNLLEDRDKEIELLEEKVDKLTDLLLKHDKKLHQYLEQMESLKLLIDELR